MVNGNNLTSNSPSFSYCIAHYFVTKTEEYAGQNFEEKMRTYKDLSKKRLTFFNSTLFKGSTTEQKKTGPLE